jgi:hypothetical protein
MRVISSLLARPGEYNDTTFTGTGRVITHENGFWASSLTYWMQKYNLHMEFAGATHDDNFLSINHCYLLRALDPYNHEVDRIIIEITGFTFPNKVNYIKWHQTLTPNIFSIRDRVPHFLGKLSGHQSDSTEIIPQIELRCDMGPEFYFHNNNITHTCNILNATMPPREYTLPNFNLDMWIPYNPLDEAILWIQKDKMSVYDNLTNNHVYTAHIHCMDQTPPTTYRFKLQTNHPIQYNRIIALQASCLFAYHNKLTLSLSTTADYQTTQKLLTGSLRNTNYPTIQYLVKDCPVHTLQIPKERLRTSSHKLCTNYIDITLFDIWQYLPVQHPNYVINEATGHGWIHFTKQIYEHDIKQYMVQRDYYRNKRGQPNKWSGITEHNIYAWPGDFSLAQSGHFNRIRLEQLWIGPTGNKETWICPLCPHVFSMQHLFTECCSKLLTQDWQHFWLMYDNIIVDTKLTTHQLPILWKQLLKSTYAFWSGIIPPLELIPQAQSLSEIPYTKNIYTWFKKTQALMKEHMSRLTSILIAERDVDKNLLRSKPILACRQRPTNKEQPLITEYVNSLAQLDSSTQKEPERKKPKKIMQPNITQTSILKYFSPINPNFKASSRLRQTTIEESFQRHSARYTKNNLTNPIVLTPDTSTSSNSTNARGSVQDTNTSNETQGTDPTHAEIKKRHTEETDQSDINEENKRPRHIRQNTIQYNTSQDTAHKDIIQSKKGIG